jgi:hypothetical protein
VLSSYSHTSSFRLIYNSHPWVERSASSDILSTSLSQADCQYYTTMGLFRGITAWLALASSRLALAAPSSPSAVIDKRYVEVRDDITYNVFEHAATGTKMSFVNNSGICETTPGVNQYSGYLSVGTDQNMFFWYANPSANPAWRWTIPEG